MPKHKAAPRRVAVPKANSTPLAQLVNKLSNPNKKAKAPSPKPKRTSGLKLPDLIRSG
jgi:hypothetical protein